MWSSSFGGRSRTARRSPSARLAADSMNATGADTSWLEAFPDGVVLLGRGERIVFSNRNASRLLEAKDHAPIVGMKWRHWWGHDSTVADRAFAEARAGRRGRLSGFCPTLSGSPRWWEIDLTLVSRNASDRPVREAADAVIMAVIREVATGRSQDVAPATAARHFEAMVNTMAQLAWMASADGQIFWFNRRWHDYTGTEPGGDSDAAWRQALHADHRERVLSRIAAAIEVGSEWEDVFPLQGAHGTYRWFLSRGRPQRSPGGAVDCWFVTHTDITEQRIQSQRLRQLARIIDLSHEAILIRDVETGAVLWNRGCEELYGYRKVDAIGVDIIALLETELPLKRTDFDAMLKREGMWSGELRQRASDGAEVWVDSRQEHILVGGRAMVLETNRDITERRRADEVRSLLVGELNHRVNNTMAIIQSLATQTARTSTTVDQFLKRFTGRLQSLASVHSELANAHWAGASINALIYSQISFAATSSERIDIAGEDVYVPPQTALQLTLILHELVTNALRHGALLNPLGRVSISWTSRQDGERPVLDLIWRETGGPAVTVPVARGFGLTLIERSRKLSHLDCELKFEPGGIVCRVVADMVSDERGEALFNPGKPLIRRGQSQQPGEKRAINLITIAQADAEWIAIEAGLASAGCIVTRLPSDLATGLPLSDIETKIATAGCDIAIVDGDDLGPRLDSMMEVLAGRGISVILLLSPPRIEIVDLLPGEPAAVLAKPVDAQRLATEVALISRHL